MTRPLARALLLSLGGALAAAAWPVRALEVLDLDRGRLVALYPARPFQLQYRHSVYGVRVWEQFTVVGTEVVLEAVEAEGEAALEYYGLPRRPVRVGDRYRVAGLNQRWRELVVRATATGQRTLQVGRAVLPLFGEGREGHRIRIRVARAPAASVVLREALRWARGGERP